MKLVASRHFSNTKNLSLKIADSQHPGHVPKGTRFEIGTAEKAEDLTADEKAKLLSLSHCVVSASDSAAVRRIDEEVKVEEEREKRLKAQQGSPVANLANQVANLMTAGAAAAAAEAEPSEPAKKK